MSTTGAALAEAVCRGDPVAVSRAISQVEDAAPGFETLLAALHPALGRAHRVGVTGPAGVGKSTLVQALVRGWRTGSEQDETRRRLAVVAVDPSSLRSGGALLGDRIRMDGVAGDEAVYIRSMATRGAQGGLALATREACDVLDAAGYQRIVVETVGVGQAELDIVQATDTIVLVLVPESGDGIQAMKSGLMEAADIFVVNKADRPAADRLVHEIAIAQRLRDAGRKRSGADGAGSDRKRAIGERRENGSWEPPVLPTVATTGEGVDALREAIESHRLRLEAGGELRQRRAAQRAWQARAVVGRVLSRRAWELADAERSLAVRREQLESGRLTPYDVARELAERLRSDGG